MGLMFLLTGLILSLYGFSTLGSPIYEKSLGIDANLIWGIVLLVFGLTMLMFGIRGQRKLDVAAKALLHDAKPKQER